MSKSSGNDDINTIFMDKIIEASMNLGLKLDDISETMAKNTAIQEKIARETDKFKNSKRSEKDAEAMVKGMLKGVVDVMRVDYGVEPTKKLSASIDILAAKFAPLIAALKDFEKYEKRIATTGVNYLASGALESIKGAERGVKTSQLYFKNTLDNEKMKGIYDDFAKKIGAHFDSAQYKILNFFQGAGQNLKKTIVGLGKDLLEGLEKSKWVGGALRDTFRLLGLIGGQWFSQFGQIGKKVGAAFYVAMELAGPQLVRLLLTGLGKLLTTILPGILNMAGKAGGALGWGNVAGAIAGTAGAAWAFNEAKDSERRSMQENANAYRVGGVTMGAGAVAFGGAGIATVLGATSIAAALGPIGIALLAIGGTVAGIAALYKAHKQKEMEHFYGTREYYDKVLAGMAELSDEEKAMTGMQGTMAGPGSAGYRAADNNNDYVMYGKMKVSKRDKSILNLHELSQKEASASLQAYEKADPEGFHSLYEWVDAKHASLGSFETDAVKFDRSGNPVAALGKKGQSREIDEFRSYLTKYLKSQGYNYNEASRIASTYMMSSGKATGSNKYHTPGSEGSRYKTHFDQYGRTIDIVGEGMNTFGGKALAAFYSTGERGYKVNVEQAGEGKSTGVHAHINPAKNVMSMAAQLNAEAYDKAREEQRVAAQQNTIAVGNILKDVDPKAYERAKKDADRVAWDYSEEGLRKESYIQELKKKGIALDTIGSTDVQAYSRTNNGQKEFAFMDDSGNVSWVMMKHAIRLIEQQGANY